MRNLILLIAILITGLVSAQNTMQIHGVTYEVVHDATQPAQIDQVWGHTVPYRISRITTSDIFIQTHVEDVDAFTFSWPAGLLNRNDTPQMRWYENGGIQNQRYANGQEWFIPLSGLNTLSIWWYWPNTDSYGVSNPLPIGIPFHATR